MGQRASDGVQHQWAVDGIVLPLLNLNHHNPPLSPGPFPDDRMCSVQAVLLAGTLTVPVIASVTVYYANDQVALHATSTASADASAYTGAAAYDHSNHSQPSTGAQPIPVAFDIQVQAGGVTGLSIPLSGSFLGFSVEFSVIAEVCACYMRCLLCL